MTMSVSRVCSTLFCVAILMPCLIGCGSPFKTEAPQVDKTLVEDYCRFIAEGKYREAYDKCLNAAYREDVTAEKFASAHEKRKAEVGVVQSREIRKVNSSRNLFSRTRDMQIFYELRYPTATVHGVMVVDDADGPWRIEGTYVTAASGTLDFKLW